MRWRRKDPLALVAALAVAIAGCSTSANHNASANHHTSTTSQPKAVLPTVTGIAPQSGTTAGGTIVTISGTGFTGTTKVAFGPVAVPKFTVISDTEITAVSPPQAASVQDIFVTTAAGTNQLVVTVDPFSYVAPIPTVTGVVPPTGSPAGGTTVTITGTGFTGAGRVAFGTVPARSYTVVSDTEITAVTPPQATGPRAVSVTTTGGTNLPAGVVDQFTFAGPVPTVTGVAPSSGTPAGGTTVTITGTGFTTTTKVTFGAVPARSYTVVSDTEITAVSPAQATGTRGIVVTTTGGASKSAGAVDKFTYKA